VETTPPSSSTIPSFNDETRGAALPFRFQQTGQVCLAVKRFYVSERCSGAFIDAFSREVNRIVVGNGLDSAATMGPLHTREARDRAPALVGTAKKRGARIETMGTVRDSDIFDKGHFMRPVITTDIADDDPLVAEEQFCPAVPILDLDDAVNRANATRYGLGGSVWGKDTSLALDVASRLAAGTVFVNTHGITSINRNAPMGV
jgi:acyl-CoA reductase-like NAD-dependent aldehyde dehydrogenase